MCLIVYDFTADMILPAVQIVGQPRSETATQCRVSRALMPSNFFNAIIEKVRKKAIFSDRED